MKPQNVGGLVYVDRHNQGYRTLDPLKLVITPSAFAGLEGHNQGYRTLDPLKRLRGNAQLRFSADP